MRLHFVTCHSLHAWHETAFRHMAPASTRGMSLRYVRCHQPSQVVWTCVSSHAASLHTWYGPKFDHTASPHTWYGPAFRHIPPAATRGMESRGCSFALVLQSVFGGNLRIVEYLCMKDVRLHAISVSFCFMSASANYLPLLVSQIKMADTHHSNGRRCIFSGSPLSY
jgi:hypothetical protein